MWVRRVRLTPSAPRPECASPRVRLTPSAPHPERGARRARRYPPVVALRRKNRAKSPNIGQMAPKHRL